MNQALIQDRRNPDLSLLAASQTKDKEALTKEGVTRVIRELQKSFDYVVCDSPAGIESGECPGFMQNKFRLWWRSLDLFFGRVCGFWVGPPTIIRDLRTNTQRAD